MCVHVLCVSGDMCVHVLCVSGDMCVCYICTLCAILQWHEECGNQITSENIIYIDVKLHDERRRN